MTPRPIGALALALLVGCDSGPPSASSTADAGVADIGLVDTTVWTAPRVDYPGARDDRPFRLSEVGLYRDIAAGVLAPDVLAFTPNHLLWSDGAEKFRWLRLPPGSVIDVTEPDHWQLPVGAQLFKAFVRDGVRVETRLIARTGPGPRDYWMGAFRWDDDQADALFVRAGQADARGTDHDIPAQKRCGTCHNGEAGRALGVAAVQLFEADPLSVGDLAAAGLLSAPVEGVDWSVPGTGTVRATLGYLHANCGNCHNPRGAAWPDTDLVLRLGVGERTPEETAIYRTSLGMPLQFFRADPGVLRVDPGAPDNSGVLLRMRLRGPREQMPPFASEQVHPEGVALVERWISAL